MTTYVITATVESFRVYWSGIEWCPARSQAKKFESREAANAHRDTNPEVHKPIPPSFIKVEHGDDEHTTRKGD